MALVRIATEADVAAVRAIYAPYVVDTAISFETEPPSEEELRSRMTTTLATGAWLVCESDGDVVGYAYAGRFHARRAYQWTVETTVYVRGDRHRRGVGRGLYTALLDCVTLQGFRTAVAIIALPNPSSVALHERLGFTCAGVLPAVGWKHGAWHDVGWWTRALATHDPDPAPPVTLAAIAGRPELARALAAGAALLRL